VSLYYVELPDVLRDAGVDVAVGSVNAGWETRSRSSGGFPSPPLAVFWHHTASKTSIENDLAWQCHNCPDRPVGNMTIDRNGTVWPVAAGASNCAGKGGPASFSRGTIPLDSGNTRGWQIEVANNGVGEAWPVHQIDAYFASSNALNAHFGNHPTDVITHQVWAPTRKIDPATAAAVQGAWRPRSSTSSGTWDLHDIRNECLARAGRVPPPTNGDDDVEKICVRDVDGFPWITDFASYAHPITEDQAGRGRDMRGWSVDPSSTGPWPIDQQDTDLMHRLSGS
jgi:hypothetical protein